MSRRAARFTVAEVVTGIRAIEQAGHVLARVEVAPDGTLSFMTVEGVIALSARGLAPATMRVIEPQHEEPEILDL